MNTYRSGVNTQNAQGQQRGELVNNRTGATSAKGGGGQLDLAQNESQSSSIALALSNVTGVTTGGIAAGMIGVWSRTGFADDTPGEFILGEGVEVDMLVDPTGAAISKMDPLKGQNGSVNFVKATAGTDRYHGIALESKATNAAVATLRAILFSSGRK
jgi:hypothetical protein